MRQRSTLSHPRPTKNNLKLSLLQCRFAFVRAGLVRCQCGKICSSAVDLKRHTSEKHKGYEASISCTRCGFASSSLHSVACHFSKCKGRKEVEANLVSCPYCARRFKAGRSLSGHQWKVHPREWAESRGRRVTPTDGDVAESQRFNYNIDISLNGFVADQNEHKDIDASFNDGGKLRVRMPQAIIATPAAADSAGPSSEAALRLNAGPLGGGDAIVSPFKGSSGVDAGANRVEHHSASALSSINAEPKLANGTLRLDLGGSAQTKPLESRETLRAHLSELAKGETLTECIKQAVIMALQTDSSSEVGAILRRLVQELPEVEGYIKSSRRRRGTKRGGMGRPRRVIAKSGSQYAGYQHMMTRSPAEVAKRIWNGSLSSDGHTRPEMSDISETFGRVMSEEGVVDMEPVTCSQEPIAVFYPVTAGDIKTILKGTSESAPGYDGLRVSKVRAMFNKNCLDVEALLNLVLLSFGEFEKLARTIMLPKGDKNLDKADNWRPITIGSHLVRMAHKVLARRIEKEIHLNPSQRGFTRLDGLARNVFLLDGIIKHARFNNKELCVVALDVAKAFPSVSHHSLFRACKRFNCSAEFRNYITELYKDNETILHCGDSISGRIPVRRGVRQGDPMSSILFNMVLDELFTVLPTELGYEFEGTRVASMAYADDVVLIAKSVTAMSGLLATTESFLAKRGLNLNGRKSAALHLLHGRRATALGTREVWSIKGEPIKMVSRDDPFTYLGVRFGPYGKYLFNPKPFVDSLKRLTKAPLKPDQRFMLLKRYMLPKVIHQLSLGCFNAGLLRKCDRATTSVVKSILHLKKDVSNALIHATTRSGGLGVMSFRDDIPRFCLNRMERIAMSNNTDVIQTLVRSNVWAASLAKVKGVKADAIVGATVAVPSPELTITARNHGARCLKAQRLHEKYDGRDLDEVAEHPISRNCIDKKPKYWSAKIYVKAIQMRCQSIECRARNSRGRGGSRWCRAGCPKAETWFHISQVCPKTHDARIKRHDAVVVAVADSVTRKGHTALIEPRIPTDAGVKKPDLVLINKDGRNVMVVDVHVAWKGMRAAHEVKVRKYGTNNHVVSFCRATGSGWRLCCSVCVHCSISTCYVGA